ncbi:phosphotransferase family protein [Nocardiopsis ganjiahuensis]|uniref:phosphotransferase family protein n=1 Tax=Nocardiopsis ganjiahuensis TaxID=239984 RepID=UPI000347D024|nr:aminoglycoside phosphotransferase family protein [Nocardiopsis ganjiahuensis]
MEAVPAAAYTIAAHHHIGPEHIRPLPRGGANHVLALGPDLVLRIPRTPDHFADLRKEATLIPLLVRAGVRTPALVDWADPPHQAPHLLLRRAPGTDLAHPGGHRPPPRVLAQIGRQLARIHTIPTTALPALAHHGALTETAPLLERLQHQGLLDAHNAHWLNSWCERLAALLPPDPAPTLVHGDLAPQNLLVSTTDDRTGALTALVDWGDAALADPATDFAKLPPHWLPPVLSAYRHTLGTPPDHPWEARVLWHHLTWALARLADPLPRPGERHWSAPPASRLLGLLHLFTCPPPAPWPDLT